MSYDYTITELTPPAAEPLTLALAKKHLAIDYTDDDELITDRITAARKLAEKHTGQIFGVRTFLLTLDQWPDDGRIEIPVEPLVSVESVSYADALDQVITLDPDQYRARIRSSPPLLVLSSSFDYPSLFIDSPDPVEIELTAGAPGDALVAEAIRLTLGYWWENPGGETALGHLSRGLPAGAIRILDNLWTGAL